MAARGFAYGVEYDVEGHELHARPPVLPVVDQVVVPAGLRAQGQARQVNHLQQQGQQGQQQGKNVWGLEVLGFTPGFTVWCDSGSACMVDAPEEGTQYYHSYPRQQGTPREVHHEWHEA